MPFVVLVVIAFLMGMVWNKRPSRHLYVIFLIGGALATVYFLR